MPKRRKLSWSDYGTIFIIFPFIVFIVLLSFWQIYQIGWASQTRGQNPQHQSARRLHPTIVSSPCNQIQALITSRIRPAISTYAAICERCELTSYSRPKSPWLPSGIVGAYIVPVAPLGRRRSSGHAKIQAAILLATLVFGVSYLIWLLFK
jgi:hypothetical protein